ncbi:MAG: hypothetical protein HGB12_17710 [Bacteroidetes bacterium]|nr:hypothetical protein [Bacteroidota bacterium]
MPFSVKGRCTTDAPLPIKQINNEKPDTTIWGKFKDFIKDRLTPAHEGPTTDTPEPK